jgi:hypothetical protein
MPFLVELCLCLLALELQHRNAVLSHGKITYRFLAQIINHEIVFCLDVGNLLRRLCARSWLARHPANIEITLSSGGSSHHTKNFFFCKNHDFFRFFINFSTVVVVKHTHVVDPRCLTHIHSHRNLNSLSLSTESTYLLVPMP